MPKVIDFFGPRSASITVNPIVFLHRNHTFAFLTLECGEYREHGRFNPPSPEHPDLVAPVPLTGPESSPGVREIAPRALHDLKIANSAFDSWRHALIQKDL